MWVLFVGWVLAAPSDSVAVSDHLDLYEVARQADASGDYTLAYQSCTASILADPDGSRVQTCRRRLQWIDARRSEGGSLTELEAIQSVRMRYTKLDPDAARTQVLSLSQQAGLSPLMSAELAVWLARDALNRLGDPERSITHVEGVWTQRLTLPQTTQREVGWTLATALATAGQYDRSRQVEESILVPATPHRPLIADRTRQEERRRLAGFLSAAILMLFGLFTIPPVLRGWKNWRAARPRGLLILGVGFVGAALLSHQWEPGSGAAIPWFALGACLIHMWTLAALESPTARHMKLGTRTGAFLATLALGYLALYWTQTLTWVGL
jgi:hypothetical protein